MTATDSAGEDVTLFTDDTDRYPRSILSFGLGLDSIAILLRWITEPASRTFDFDDLAVVTAMTGDEYLSTSTTSKRSCCPKCAEGLSPTSDIAYEGNRLDDWCR